MKHTDEEHKWQPVGIVKQTQREVRYLGTTLASTRTNDIAVQSCECGAIKRTIVAYGEWDH